MKPLQKIEWQDVESSNIKSTFYHDPSQTICVRFNSGGLYSYMAPKDVYVDFVHAPSMGAYLNAVIKAFPYTRWGTEQELLHHLNVV
jgi:hypothetical protein